MLAIAAIQGVPIPTARLFLARLPPRDEPCRKAPNSPANEQARKRLTLYLLFGGGVLIFLRLLRGGRRRSALTGYSSFPIPTDDSYDVAIIGAGPSGATCAYYLAKAGRKVALLEKAKFPRDKYCGDAVTTLAQRHLKEMGVLQELEREGKIHWSQTGGFVSPSGYSFIALCRDLLCTFGFSCVFSQQLMSSGNSAKEINRSTEGVAVAIKRIHMDEKVARAAQRAGADLREENQVVDAVFNTATGFWTVKCMKGDNTQVEYRARVLIAADGAPSGFARQKGIVKTEPDGVCSRSYVTGNHNFQCDGVVFYPPELLPGYCAIFRHANNELGWCVYVIPGGPVTVNDLHKVHHKLQDNDPFISRALAGSNVQFEPMKGAPLRLSTIPKSYGDHFLIIGDAAGFIDPLTGEGIQYAMESGKIAADILIDALKTGDLSEEALSRYQDRWMSEWGREFYWSMKMSLFLYRFPILLDGAAKLIKKRGARFLGEWANVMTRLIGLQGTGSKLWFLRPDVGPLIFLEALGIAVQRLLGVEKKPRPE